MYRYSGLSLVGSSLVDRFRSKAGVNADEDAEFPYVAFIKPPRFCVCDVGEPFVFGGTFARLLYCAGVKVCLPMTTRSAIPPAPGRLNAIMSFIMLGEGDLFEGHFCELFGIEFCALFGLKKAISISFLKRSNSLD